MKSSNLKILKAVVITAGMMVAVQGICAETKQTNTQTHANTQAQGKQTKLLAIAGSTRKDSCNKKALDLLAKAATQAGATVTVVDLSQYSLPMFNEDFEKQQGLPENAKKLQKLMSEHQGFLIASPEYNGLPTPLLLNTIAWASREDKNNPQSGLKVFEGKKIALISASPGQMGGKRNLPITAQLFSNLGSSVIADRVSIANCYESFDGNGNLKNAALMSEIDKQGKKIVAVVGQK